MSEFEKLKRDEYQKRRKEIIYFLTAIALILALITASFSIIFVSLDANTYVYYQENGSALYHAYLSENEYYEEDRLNGSHAYVSSLIDHMDVVFRYESKMDAEDVTYQYKYRVDAQLVIEDTRTGAAIYNPKETVLGPTSKVFQGKNLVLAPTVEIDYVAYNEKAKAFIADYNLTGVTSYLNVTMFVEVIGMSELFAADNEGQYTVEVHIPLAQNVLKPEVSSTIPTGPQKVLSNPNKGKSLFMVLAIIFGVLDAAAIGCAVVYTLKTRDMHIDYSRKVQRLVNNYKSFIQKINTPFERTGYQALEVNTFTEMLEIRDTLQMPILMYENEDRTCTTFMIPFDSRLLYIYEIKVENYDELYSPVDLTDDIDAEIKKHVKIETPKPKKKRWSLWSFFKTGIAEIDAIDDIEIHAHGLDEVDKIKIGDTHHDEAENEDDREEQSRESEIIGDSAAEAVKAETAEAIPSETGKSETAEAIAMAIAMHEAAEAAPDQADKTEPFEEGEAEASEALNV